MPNISFMKSISVCVHCPWIAIDNYRKSFCWVSDCDWNVIWISETLWREKTTFRKSHFQSACVFHWTKKKALFKRGMYLRLAKRVTKFRNDKFLFVKFFNKHKESMGNFLEETFYVEATSGEWKKVFGALWTAIFGLVTRSRKLMNQVQKFFLKKKGIFCVDW